jgi:hypothetical protein
MRHLNKIVIFVCCLLIAASSVGQKKPGKPVPIIFDSDMGPDYDDVGAITLLHALADSGQATILATMASTNFEGVAAVMNAFNTYFKRSGTPVGVPKGKAVGLRDFQHWTDSIIANYPHDINSNAEARDAIDVYRQVLANQPDNSVTIVTVGFLTNLANLQNSASDKWSKLNGKELIKKKVKLLVCMAGIFPKGKEFNVEKMQPPLNRYFPPGKRLLFSAGLKSEQKYLQDYRSFTMIAFKTVLLKMYFAFLFPWIQRIVQAVKAGMKRGVGGYQRL